MSLTSEWCNAKYSASFALKEPSISFALRLRRYSRMAVLSESTKLPPLSFACSMTGTCPRGFSVRKASVRRSPRATSTCTTSYASPDQSRYHRTARHGGEAGCHQSFTLPILDGVRGCITVQ